jgi:N-methylhydantoinase A
MKEYERTSTTVVNAYIQPIMRSYIEELERGLAGIGIGAPLLVVTSNGGVASAKTVAERPVFAVGSGPAAGVVGAARLGRSLGLTELIVLDKGGTTAKASVVEAGEPTLTSEYEFREGISTPSRFIKAGGYMLKVPAVDIAEVGSGGGSIATIDSGRLLRVGPESAGAEPGPACYGLGGEQPTVTDANVVLGYLNPHALAGGSLKIDKARAEDAIRRYVAEPLGLSVNEAASGIRSVVNASMVRAIRGVTIERGRDPRRFTLVAFGGSGPAHAVELARALEIRRVLVPTLSGVFSAVGMLASDVEHHFVRSAMVRLDRINFAALNTMLDEMSDQGRSRLTADGYDASATRLRFLADLRYAGQGSELTIPLAGPALAPSDLPALTGAFAAEYQRTYGYAESDPLELVNLRLVASGIRTDRLAFERLGGVDIASQTRTANRLVYLGRELGMREVNVLDRSDLLGRTVAGPAIIESYESTVAVPQNCDVGCDKAGNILIEVG